MVEAFKTRRGTKLSSGVREIDAVVRLLESREPIKRAIADRAIATFGGPELDHGRNCTITALSPSDRQYEKSLDEIARLIPGLETKRRAVAQNPNHLTVVTWVDFGDLAILLGGDLEQTQEEDTGWAAIVRSGNRPQGKACVFKIPHHGSRSGHNDSVWEQMLVCGSFAVLAPWHLSSRSLPTKEDIARILSRTPNAYSSSPVRVSRTNVPRAAAVARQLREMGVALRQPEPPTGAVRLRNGGRGAWHDWTVSLQNEACHLSKAISAS
jgi:hypothetical protein